MVFTRRRLPHLYAAGVPLFVTFRLHGSLPRGRGFAPASASSGEVFALVDRMLDGGGSGPLFLKIPEVATVVVDGILHGEFVRHAWVVMPNHVHLLMTSDLLLPEVMRRLKGRTAAGCNRVLGRSGTFWQEESYDRLVRTQAEFERIVRYIEWNPVRAGLVHAPEDWRWSSAFFRLRD